MSSQSSHPNGGISRYLYRVYSVREGESNGLDSDIGFLSAGARNKICHPSLADMQYVVAQTKLRKHLAWIKTDLSDDEFISWTSSLLYALVSAVRKTRKSADHELKVCVLDTSRFHTGTFFRASQLIRDYALSGSSVINNADHTTEYLVQGSLNVRNSSSTVSLACLRECGLFDLMPELGNEDWKQRLVPRVQDLRTTLFSAVKPLSATTCQRALRVASPFGGEWTMAMTIALLALRGSPRNLEVLLPLIGEVAVPGRDFLDALPPDESHCVDAPELANFAKMIDWAVSQMQTFRHDGVSQLNARVSNLGLGSDGVADTTSHTPETTSAAPGDPSSSTAHPTATRAPGKVALTMSSSTTPMRVMAPSLQVRFRDVQPHPDRPTGMIQGGEDDDDDGEMRATDRVCSAAIPLGSGRVAGRVNVRVEFSADASGGVDGWDGRIEL